MTTPEDTELRKAISGLPIVDPHDTTLGEYIGCDSLDELMNLITLHTQKAVAEVIGEDEDIVYGTGFEVVMNAILSQSNNKLRAVQRQTLAKLFNKEEISNE